MFYALDCEWGNTGINNRINSMPMTSVLKTCFLSLDILDSDGFWSCTSSLVWEYLVIFVMGLWANSISMVSVRPFGWDGITLRFCYNVRLLVFFSLLRRRNDTWAIIKLIRRRHIIAKVFQSRLSELFYERSSLDYNCF